MRLRGFTMVEMLVVMTISAILIAAAVPSFNTMIARSRSSSASSTLLSNLELARSEAIRRNQNVTMCRTLDANAPEASVQCSSAASAQFDGNDWASGWIVFAKFNVLDNASVFDLPAGDTLLMRQPASTTGVTRAAIWSTAPGPQRIAYRGNGTSLGVISSRFFTDYRTVPTPTLADRDPDSITLTYAARCLAVAGGTGRPRAYRPVSDTCPPL